MNATFERRSERDEREERARRIGFRDSAIGFGLMTALVIVASTGLFILLDPRAQAFWGAKLSELVALVRGLLPF